MFWNVFYNLCEAAETSPTSVIKELGIATGSVTAWKKGVMPSTRSLQKIADYFGVTVADLLADSPTTVPAAAPSAPSNEDLASQIAELRAAISAGARTDEPALSPARREAIEIIKRLDDSQLDDVMMYVKFLESQNK